MLKSLEIKGFIGGNIKMKLGIVGLPNVGKSTGRDVSHKKNHPGSN